MLPNAAQIQNVNLARVRQKIADLRGPPWSQERAQVADAFDAIIDLIAPYSRRPENLDVDALLAGYRGPLPPEALAALETAVGEWNQPDTTKAE